MKNGYKFFKNKECIYYPCHKELKEMNCLFCFCPLYHLKECGGSYTYTDQGIKDCSGCIFPHIPENYDKIIEKLSRMDG